jgi:hypothetical protein
MAGPGFSAMMALVNVQRRVIARRALRQMEDS